MAFSTRFILSRGGFGLQGTSAAGWPRPGLRDPRDACGPVKHPHEHRGEGSGAHRRNGMRTTKREHTTTREHPPKPTYPMNPPEQGALISVRPGCCARCGGETPSRSPHGSPRGVGRLAACSPARAPSPPRTQERQSRVISPRARGPCPSDATLALRDCVQPMAFALGVLISRPGGDTRDAGAHAQSLPSRGVSFCPAALGAPHPGANPN